MGSALTFPMIGRAGKIADRRGAGARARCAAGAEHYDDRLREDARVSIATRSMQCAARAFLRTAILRLGYMAADDNHETFANPDDPKTPRMIMGRFC